MDWRDREPIGRLETIATYAFIAVLAALWIAAWVPDIANAVRWVRSL